MTLLDAKTELLFIVHESEEPSIPVLLGLVPGKERRGGGTRKKSYVHMNSKNGIFTFILLSIDSMSSSVSSVNMVNTINILLAP